MLDLDSITLGAVLCPRGRCGAGGCNFWRVVLAGWVIRYPKIVWVPIGFLIVLIYNAVVN
jgi:hypothetical protein